MEEELKELLKPYAQVIHEIFVEYVTKRTKILFQTKKDLELQEINCLCVPGRVMLVVDNENTFTFGEEDFT